MSAAQTPRSRSASPGALDHRRVRRGLRAAGALLRTWRRRARERSELARLSDRELRDFGVSRGEAITEAVKPFWRPD